MGWFPTPKNCIPFSPATWVQRCGELPITLWSPSRLRAALTPRPWQRLLSHGLAAVMATLSAGVGLPTLAAAFLITPNGGTHQGGVAWVVSWAVLYPFLLLVVALTHWSHAKQGSAPAREMLRRQSLAS